MIKLYLQVQIDTAQLKLLSVSMTANVSLLSGGKGQCLQLPVDVQSVRPHTKFVHRQPVIRLWRLPADSLCFGRSDSLVVTGRRPSHVYGDSARARWTKGRRPLARSAAAIRAARAAKLAVASADAESSSNCFPETTKPSAQEKAEAGSTTVHVVANVHCSNGDIISGMATSPRERLLSIKKFYRSCVATKPHLVTSPSTTATADFDVVDRRDSHSDRVPVSPSNSDRKRKSSRQQAAKRVKKTYGKTPNRNDRLNSRNVSLSATSWSACRRGPLINSRRRNAARSTETSPAKDESKQQRTPTSVGDDVGTYDDLLSVVAMDEKYAAVSIAAMNLTAHRKPSPLNCSESLAIKPETSPVSVTSTSIALPTSDSTVASTKNLKSRNRAEHTIFERFINALSLHKPLTSDKDVGTVPVVGLIEAKAAAVPETVSDVKFENKMLLKSNDMDDKLLETTDQQLSNIPMKDKDETIDNSSKTPCRSLGVIDVSSNPALDSGESSTGETKACEEVGADDNARKRNDGGAKLTDGSKRQNEDRRTRGVKVMSRYTQDSELLVTTRPVRKRQPTTYIDSGFQKSAKSGRKVNSNLKSRWSCLLPPDFDLSFSRSPGATRKSWRTVLDRPEKSPAKRCRESPKKTRQKYSRQKGTAVDDEVRWTIQKKLLLDRPTSSKRKSVQRSKFPGKRKLKAAPKSTTFISRGGKLWTRSMTRVQQRKSSAGDATARTADKSPVIALTGKKEELLGDVAPVSLVTSSSSSSTVTPANSAVVDRCDLDSDCLPVAPLKYNDQSRQNSAVPSSCDDAASSLNVSFSREPAAEMQHASAEGDEVKETTSSTTTSTTTTTTTNAGECVEPLDSEAAVETVSETSLLNTAQPGETEPEVPASDVTSGEETSSGTRQSVSKIVGNASTSTAATNTDECKVDEESVEALMHLVKQLHDAVASEKLRKAKGQSTCFTGNEYTEISYREER